MHQMHQSKCGSTSTRLQKRKKHVKLQAKEACGSQDLFETLCP